MAKTWEDVQESSKKLCLLQDFLKILLNSNMDDLRKYEKTLKNLSVTPNPHLLLNSISSATKLITRRKVDWLKFHLFLFSNVLSVQANSDWETGSRKKNQKRSFFFFSFLLLRPRRQRGKEKGHNYICIWATTSRTLWPVLCWSTSKKNNNKSSVHVSLI